MIALLVYSARGGHPGTFLFSQLVNLRLGATVQKWLFAGFFIAFADQGAAVAVPHLAAGRRRLGAAR